MLQRAPPDAVPDQPTERRPRPSTWAALPPLVAQSSAVAGRPDLKPDGIARIWQSMRGGRFGALRSGGIMATGVNLSNLASAMDNADFVLIDGVVFATEYMRVPDEGTVADDVVLEAKHGDTEVTFTRQEMDGALHLGEGVYRLKSGAELRFLSSATLH